MKIPLLPLFVLLSCSVFAQTLLTEDFSYSAGSRLTANGWVAHSSAGTNAIATVSPGLLYAGLSPQGSAVAMTTSGEDISRTFSADGIRTGATYASFLVRISAAQSGDYFFHLGPATLGSAFAARVYVQSSEGGVKFGLSKGAVSSGSVVGYTSMVYGLNQVHWLVLKYEFSSGTNDDRVSLYINPAVATTEPVTAALTDENSADFANIGTVALRQGTAANAPTLQLGYLQVGTSWQDVTNTSIANPQNPTLPQALTIDQARKAPVNTLVKIAGRVTVGKQFNNVLYLQDATGGVPVFLGTTPNVFSEGDSVLVTGTMRTFNAQIQIGDGNTPIISIEKVGTTRGLVAPKTIKISELASNEGALVSIQNVVFQNPTKGLLYPDANFDISTTDGTGTVRIGRYTDVGGYLKPTQAGTVTGVIGRFKNTATVGEGYQLLVRQREDIARLSAIYSVPEGNLSRDLTLDIAAWNVTWLGNVNNGPANEILQVRNVKQVMDSLRADVYILSEVADETQFSNLLTQLNGSSTLYQGRCSNEVSGGGAFADVQRVCFVYRTDVIKNPTFRPLLKGVTAAMLPNYPIDANRFWASGRLPFLMTADATINGFTQKINIVGIHARANTSGAEAETVYQQRQYDFKVLKDTLDARFDKDFLFVAGDYNEDADETVATITSTKNSSFKAIVDDASRYRVVTKILSDNGFRTFVSQENIIDHLTISDELFPALIESSVGHALPFRYINDYPTTTSDHYPIFARFDFQKLITATQPLPTANPQIYPNPTAHQWVYLKSADPVKDVQLLDLTGRTVHSHWRLDSEGLYQIIFATKIGFYTVRIATKTGVSHLKLLVE